ncbi:MAG TPA: heme-binding domain-containing protein [Flavobacteriales bacterium]|nr:heme-binding domain-containing protein [Flavobacteriales bacterium]
MKKRILYILLAIAVVAQFFQPDRSAPATDPANDMLAITKAPADIQQLVIGACYDCHSYKTNYPWYGKITPVNFIVQNHINEGREVLNFSLWDQFANSEAAGESGETIQESEMPPAYYRFMHGHGDLSAAQQQQLIAWFGSQGGAHGAGTESEKGEGTDND